jgi:hypothetical protein
MLLSQEWEILIVLTIFRQRKTNLYLKKNRVNNTEILAIYTEQSPSWEVTSHSASQEILLLLWNLKVHYCVHKGLPLVPIFLARCIQSTPSHPISVIHSNVILPFVPWSCKWSLPFKFSNQNIVCISHLACVLHAHSCQPPWFDHPAEVLQSKNILYSDCIYQAVAFMSVIEVHCGCQALRIMCVLKNNLEDMLF